MKWRRRFGPGFLVAAAFIGPGTVTTASLAGARQGYALAWAILAAVLATLVLQEMAARLGSVGRMGLGEALRASFPTAWLRAAAIGLALMAITFGNAAYQAGNLTGAALGMEGGMVQMISHGFISGALFLCVGVLYDRMHSRQISDYGGVVNSMPIFGAFMVLFAMANSGLPGTSGFVGEFMVILASFKANFWFALLAATTLILGAAYSLWMVKRVVFGDIANDNVRQLQDVNLREFGILASLAIVVLLFGLWPAPLVEVMHASVNNLLIHLSASKLPPETGLALLQTVTP
jgi:NADH:ubiquinone oxidoreductase subunit 4 (subunit M)